MIYDCFTYFNEIELLELRLKILSEEVDYFVLVEANKTFTNEDKEFLFENNKHLFTEYLDRIIHIKVDDMPNSDNAWDREAHQRNCIIRGLQKCQPDDLILISDIDEIPNPFTLKLFLLNQIKPFFTRHWVKNKVLNLWYKNRLLEKLPVAFDQDFFYYFLNCKMDKKWSGSVLLKFKNITGSVEDIRALRNTFPKIKNGGWHFSYLGGIDRIIKKLKSFSHTEYNLPEITSSEWITKKMNSGEDLFGRDSKFDFIDINTEFPFKAADLIEKYPYLHLDR